jgi:hypothetical protein
MNGFSDVVPFALGGVVAAVFLGAALALGAAERAFDWAASRLAIPPRGSQ